MAGNSCGNNACETLDTGGCLCSIAVSESLVFNKMPRSVDEVLSKLTIGAYDPASYPEGTYLPHTTVNGVTAYLVTSSGAFDKNTVFEVIDNVGRLFRLRNIRSTVAIQGASTYAFRNAPSFMSVLNTEVSWPRNYFNSFSFKYRHMILFHFISYHPSLTVGNCERCSV